MAGLAMRIFDIATPAVQNWLFIPADAMAGDYLLNAGSYTFPQCRGLRRHFACLRARLGKWAEKPARAI